jgi:hypothetical protein
VGLGFAFKKFSCVSQQVGFKTTTKLIWESPCHKLYKKAGAIFSPVIFLFGFYFIAFLAVSLHGGLKNTTAMLLEIKPENLKKKSKKGQVGASYVRPPPLPPLSLSAPCRLCQCPQLLSSLCN